MNWLIHAGLALLLWRIERLALELRRRVDARSAHLAQAEARLAGSAKKVSRRLYELT